MNLYERDFTSILTEEEYEAYRQEIEFKQKVGIKSLVNSPRLSHPDKDVREFLWKKCSYFPNNHLYMGDYKAAIDFEEEAASFSQILSESRIENQIQNYIKSNRKWFIPGSIFLDYNFGNHSAYLFPEQKLGNDYSVDYMLLGENSDGYSIVLVEFENANTEFILETRNAEADCVRKGITQIRDWKRWMDSNRDYFMRNIGLSNLGIDIPTFRIYYYLVVSRREFMNKRALDLRGQLVYENPNLKIVSFDRLVDNVHKLENFHTW